MSSKLLKCAKACGMILWRGKSNDNKTARTLYIPDGQPGNNGRDVCAWDIGPCHMSRWTRALGDSPTGVQPLQGRTRVTWSSLKDTGLFAAQGDAYSPWQVLVSLKWCIWSHGHVPRLGTGRLASVCRPSHDSALGHGYEALSGVSLSRDPQWERPWSHAGGEGKGDESKWKDRLVTDWTLVTREWYQTLKGRAGADLAVTGDLYDGALWYCGRDMKWKYGQAGCSQPRERRRMQFPEPQDGNSGSRKRSVNCKGL